MQEGKLLGQMKPLGGGDPIPLKKKEVVIGRRASSDIRLDFENVSGRHCMLTFANGTWNVRDLGSTNGTKVNGQKLQREQGILPDDELAIASHLFHVDYEPASSLVDSHQLLEDEDAIREAEARKPTSLMELAGFSDRVGPKVPPQPEGDRPKAVAPVEQPAPEDPPLDEFEPSGNASAPPTENDDDDFFKLIEDEVRHNRS